MSPERILKIAESPEIPTFVFGSEALENWTRKHPHSRGEDTNILRFNFLNIQDIVALKESQLFPVPIVTHLFQPKNALYRLFL